MEKIIIFYASYGGGHLSAAKSIENYIKKHYPEKDVQLIDCMKYINKTFEKISTAAYREMAKKMPWAWGKIYNDSQKGPLAHITSRTNAFMAVKLLKLLKKEQPDLIISTHPFGSQMSGYLKRKGKIDCEIATIMTDFKSHDQWLVENEFVNYFFVSNDDMKNELINKNIANSKIYVTGIPINEKFLNNFNKTEILNNLNFSENKKTILFFAGGEYGIGKSTTLQIFEYLLKNFDNIQIIAISGKNENMKNNFIKITEKNNKQNCVRIFEYTDKVPELMSISELVITKPGGLTTSEALVSELPIVIINPIPGQEEENADFLERHHVALWIKKADDINLSLNLLLNDDNIINNIKENINLISKPNSTKDICDILLKK